MLIRQPKKWSRRAMLGSVGAGALLPFVPILNGHAAAEGFPQRLIVFHTATGTHLPSWRPSGGESTFELPEILAPLQAYRDRLIVVDGLDNLAHHDLGSGHRGYATLWTGSRLVGATEDIKSPTRPSLDQIIAAEIGRQTPFASRHAGIRVFHQNSDTQKVAFWAGQNQPVYPVQTPRGHFEQMFAELQLDPAELAKRRAQRRSVIDWVKDDIARIQGRVGADDRARVEEHLGSIQELEAKLDNDYGAHCEVPEPPGDFPEYTPSEQIPDAVRHMLDLIVQSFACDLTRVHTFQWASSPGGGTPVWLQDEPYGFEGQVLDMHELSHDGSDVGRRNWTRVQRWNADNVKYLLDGLAAIPEGDGTLLDNCLIVWASEMLDGSGHWYRNVPVVLVDGPTGFETGRHLRYGNYEYGDDPLPNDYGTLPMNRLLVSICNRMGLGQIEEVGDPEFGIGPAPGLDAFS